MSNMVTRCPKCATSFRITSAQLQSAKGAVRCGSCLHIFKAQDHLIGTQPSTAAPKTNDALKTKTVADTKKAVTASPAATQTVTTKIPTPTSATAKESVTKENALKANIASPAKSPVIAQSPTTAGESTTKPQPNKANIAASKPAASTVQTRKPIPKPALSAAQLAAQSVAVNATKPAVKSANTKPIAPPANTNLTQAADKLIFNQSQIDQEMAELGDDDRLISDDMDNPKVKTSTDGYDFDEFLNLDAQLNHSNSLFERKDVSRKPKDIENTDESWAENLLDEADAEQRFHRVKQQIIAAEEQQKTPDKSSKLADISPNISTNSTPAFKGPIFSLVNDTETDSDANSYKEIFTEEELSQELHALDRQNAQTTDEAVASNSPMRAYDTSRAALLLNIMPEPVEMTSRRKRSWQRKYLWAFLSLLMVLVLIIQIAWLQFNHLSRIEPYRSVYAMICPLIGCHLPILMDRKLIQVRQLSVRKHPDVDNALLVDVILINAAPFEQPFPDLIMAFSDINEQAVAARRFHPREYLAGELAGKELMPNNRPIYISLELVDPGETAVNYKIEPF